MIGTLTRRSLRARLGRSIFIGLTILLGVSFVSGSFVLADSLKATFDNLFTSLNEDVDFEVRRTLTVDVSNAERDPVPAELLDEIAAVPGVARTEGVLARYALMLDQDGDPIATNGAPAFGISWGGEDSSVAGVQLKAGRAPADGSEAVIDKATADRVGYEVGDSITVVFDTGQRSFEIVGLVGLGNADGFGGATITLLDPVTAVEVFDAAGVYDVIDLQIEDGADAATVRAAIDDILPERTEVVSGQEVADETAGEINEIIDAFGTGLLVFAFVTAFVSSFIINNIFGITIGQRLRELALLRAVGASARQVQSLVVVEALIVSVVATIIGTLGGLGVAKALIGFFNAAGAGFPPTPLQLQLRTVVISAAVGIGITLLSVVIPAVRASRIPPVAAMRPELGFSAIGANKRLAVGSIVTVVGAIAFLTGMLVRPGGSLALIVLGGGGGLAVFLGISSLSATVARPVVGFIGRPLRWRFGVSGALAVDNAQRSPRRTARTASALMIGVSLVTAAAVFATSLRDTFTATLSQTITADYIIADNQSQLPLPSAVAETLNDVPELSAVSPFRILFATIADDDEQIAAIDPVGFPNLADLGVVEGGYEGLLDGRDGIVVQEEQAQELGLAMGDTVEVVYQNEREGTLTVSGIFSDASLPFQWYISLETLQSVIDQDSGDFFVLAAVADGLDRDAAKPAVAAAIEGFPQAEVQTNAEFRSSQEDQINQLLAVITGLLSMAMIIAVIGIAITLALSVFERTREIGLLRAVGMSRRKLKRSIRWEAVLVSVFGAIVGVVVGLFLGVVLSIAVPNNIIDGVTMPWGNLVTILFAAVLAGIVAAWWPARKGARMNVLEAISTE